MRPAIKSGLLPVWRDRDTLQIGIDSRRAIALTGMGQAAFLIGLLDGSRDRDQVIAAAATRGIPVRASERILTLLAAGGALDDFPAATLRELSPLLRARLAPELATASLAHGDGDGGASFLARRRSSLVWIDGDRRIGRAIARILSAAGVGAIRIGAASHGLATCQPMAARAQPGGPARLSADQVTGSDRGGAGTSAARPNLAGAARSGPKPGNGPDLSNGASRSSRADHGDVDRGGARSGYPKAGPYRASRDGSQNPPAVAGYRNTARRPDLAVLVGRPGQELPDQLVRDRLPHLAVLASEAIGIVGPLVIPGKTACLRCLDYVRAANDPSWPLILAQLTSRRPEPPACDAVLATAVAAQAAAQVLTTIDKAPGASAAANGTLELVLPDWRWRRRTWPAHPACPCTSHTSR